MTTEERLSDALHSVHDSARPSPDLEGRILERVSGRTRWRLGFSPRLRLGAPAAAILLVVAIVAVASGGAWGRRPGSMASESGPTWSQSASPIPLAHFDQEGLAFDYPASWLSGSGYPVEWSSGSALLYEPSPVAATVYYLGTGLFCSPSPSATDGSPTATDSCSNPAQIGPGQVLVSVLKYADPTLRSPIDPSNASTLRGESFISVGGLPAESTVVGQTGSAETLLDLTLSVPGSIDARYRIQVDMREPGLDELTAEVTALIASVRYDPPPVVLDPADASRAAAVGLQKAAAADPSLACWPTTPGWVEATMAPGPCSPAVTGTIDVTYLTKVEPYAIGLWKLTLAETWNSIGGGDGAGMIIIWLAPDGTPGPEWSGSFPGASAS